MTKEIICSDGDKILVDDEDYPVISRHKWHYSSNGKKNRFYAVARVNVSEKAAVRTVAMHNMILGFAFNVDHIDGDTHNNTKANLRPATYQENGWNTPAQKTARGKPRSSQYKGVSYRPLKGVPRWAVLIKHVEHGKHKSTGKTLRLGYFFDEVEAAKAYNKKIVELRGDRAWLNPIPS